MAGKNRDLISPGSLAILDWGVGGLGFYRFFKRDFPHHPVVYISDSGFKPYGLASPRELNSRLLSILSFLKSHGIRTLAVACNAMSTILAPEPVWEWQGVRVLGIITPTLVRLKSSPHSPLGVIGGRRTILSGVYARPLRRKGKEVRQRVAQPLSALIEAGRQESPEFRRKARAVLKPLRGCRSLVLGCTHYIAAADLFKDLLPGVELVDPAWETFLWFKRQDMMENSSGGDWFLTSGNTEGMKSAAQKAFSLNIDSPRPLDLSRETGGEQA